jgi:hypothetical protein
MSITIPFNPTHDVCYLVSREHQAQSPLMGTYGNHNPNAAGDDPHRPTPNVLGAAQ